MHIKIKKFKRLFSLFLQKKKNDFTRNQKNIKLIRNWFHIFLFFMLFITKM